MSGWRQQHMYADSAHENMPLLENYRKTASFKDIYKLFLKTKSQDFRSLPN